MAFDAVAYNDMYREYISGAEEDLIYKEKVLTPLFTQDTKAGGRLFEKVVKYSLGAGGSATFTDANDDTQESQAYDRWQVPYRPMYEIQHFDNNAVEQAENDETALKEMLKEGIDDVVTRQGVEYEIMLHSSGWGSRGTIKTGGVSGATITLNDRSSAKRFRKGMRLVASSAESGAGLLNGGVVGTVAKVNTVAGTITLTANVDASWVAGSHLFRKGDRQATGTTQLLPVGIPGWLAAPVPAENFFGVDRTTDSKLAAVRVSVASLNIVQALFTLAQNVADNGFGMRKRVAVVSNLTFGSLMSQAYSKFQIQATEIKARGPVSFGLAGALIQTPGGPVEVVPDYYMLDSEIWMLDPATWFIGVAGKGGLFRSALKNGDVLDSSTADMMSVRRKSLSAVLCNCPGANAVGTGGTFAI